MNAQMLDGNNNALSYVGEVGVPPAVDAVEEFKVQSGAMSSEFGFTAGGTINLVTKSGTNEFHGTAYEFLRNDKFDARNTFATSKPPLRYNQYGTSLGGPILKNRLFGFFNWEEYKLRKSTPRISSVPTQEWREGNFSRLLTNTGALIPIYDPATTRPNPNGSGQIRDLFPGNIIPSEPVRQNYTENPGVLPPAQSHTDQPVHPKPELSGFRDQHRRLGSDAHQSGLPPERKQLDVRPVYVRRTPDRCQ